MAITRNLKCDSCGDCTEDWGWTSAAEVRKYAKEDLSEPWHYSNSRDICPECWKIGER